MPGFIVRINDDLIYFSPVNNHVNTVAAALTHLEFSISEIAKYGKLFIMFIQSEGKVANKRDRF